MVKDLIYKETYGWIRICINVRLYTYQKSEVRREVTQRILYPVKGVKLQIWLLFSE